MLRRIFSHIARMGPPQEHAGVPLHAPVLIVPRVFEPDLCERLIYRGAGVDPEREMDWKQYALAMLWFTFF